MLLFGVFLRETAHPVAKSRTNLAQIQEKLPNGWTDWHQIYRFILEWIYAKQIAPRDTRGNFGGLGGQPIKGQGLGGFEKFLFGSDQIYKW